MSLVYNTFHYGIVDAHILLKMKKWKESQKTNLPFPIIASFTFSSWPRTSCCINWTASLIDNLFGPLALLIILLIASLPFGYNLLVDFPDHSVLLWKPTVD